jgi:AcrR family transcriptional regulator
VPRTRVEATREDKAAAIVDAAARKLREHGAAGLSVAAIARELGVAQNTLYWYFPSRDHLFVAALQRVFGDMIQLKRAQNLALADEVVWFVEQLHAVAPLRAALFERARDSAVVAEFAGQLQAVLRLMLGNALRPHVDAERLDDVVGVFSATVEGLLVQPVDAGTRERLVRLALDALTAGRLGRS